MKRIAAVFLTLCLMLALTVPALGADASGAVQTVQTLGILQGDETGNTELSGQVSRAEFAAMLAASSAYKDSTSREGSGYSLFRDVKSGYWASEAIQLAIRQGWMSGYTDGTFRPEQGVTLEEACAALLKLLGYDASSLAGSFPQAQLSKASALGLRDGVSAQRGQTLTRGNCVVLFYNLLTAKNSSGQVYGTALGYTVTNGEVDYSSVALENVSGPYIAENGLETVPFQPRTVYKNNAQISEATMAKHNVYYYNESAKTLWIYTKQVSGRIESLSPSSTSPTSVTVAGTSYEIGTSEAAYALSAVGGGKVGSMTTLLLGMNDAVVAVLPADEVDTVYYGVVKSTSEIVDDEKAAVKKQVTVTCTDGEDWTFTLRNNDSLAAGLLVTVDVKSDGVAVQRLNQKTTRGKVSGDASSLGKLRIAADAQILDVSRQGDAAVVDAGRLAGVDLKDGHIRYYALNQQSEISVLILNDVTGDTWKYGYLTPVTENVTETEGGGWKTESHNYTYLLNGTKTTLQTTGNKYPAGGERGIALRFDSGGEVKEMKSLASVPLVYLGALTARSENKTYDLAEDLQIYLKQDDGYYLADREAVNAEDYTLTGYYDDLGCPAGGRIRVILAEKK